jgi:uncharacterized membrane protein
MEPLATETASTTDRRNHGFVWYAFVAATLIYAIPSLWMLRNYVQSPYDLAIYDQTLWLIWNGESFNTLIASHIFGVHFSPILILFSPLAAIPGGAAPEIIAQSVLIASGVFPARKLAIEASRSPIWFMLFYAIHPAIVGGSWFGFRAWNLAVAPLMWAVYLIWKRPTTLRVVMLGLVGLLFREDLAFWVVLAILLLVLGKRVRWQALILPGAILGLATGIVMITVAPLLSPTESFFFATPGESGGDTFAAGISSFVLRITFLLAPLAISPLRLNWPMLVPLAVPMAGLIWKGGNALTTYYHYDMLFVPLLLLVVVSSPEVRLRVPLSILASITLLVTIGALRPFAPLRGSNPFKVDSVTTEYFDDIMEVVRMVDRTATLSVSAPPRLVPHMSERSNVFLFPSPIDQHQGFAAPIHFREAVEYECPPPTVAIIDEAEPVSAWSGVLRSQFRLVEDFGQFSVWRADQDQPDKPCKANWSYQD